MNGRAYSVNMDLQAITGAISLIEVTAASDRMLILLSAWVTQETSESSTQGVVQLVRKSAAGTGTAFTPLPLQANQGAAGFTAATELTAEGTVTDLLERFGYNILNGWLYVPLPEERIWLPVSGILAIRFPTAPAASINVSAGMTLLEVG